jgi:hypothetical protein
MDWQAVFCPTGMLDLEWRSALLLIVTVQAVCATMVSISGAPECGRQGALTSRRSPRQACHQ